MNKFLPFVMSGILALPMTVFAASSVRTLGGSGTYNGVTSVGSGTATRAGSVRAVPAVKVSKTTTTSATTSPSTSGSTGTVSGATGTGTRMSMGKYLSGLGAAATKVSTSTAAAEFADDMSGLMSSLDDLAKQVAALESSDDVTATELATIWKSLDDISSELDTDYLTKAEIEDLSYIDEAALNTALAEYTKSTVIENTYAKKTDIPTPTNIADIIAGAVESGKLELSGYAKTTDLNDYAKTSVLESYATREAVNNVFFPLGVRVETVETTVDSLDTKIDSTKTELNTKIENLEAGIPSFEIYSGAFDPTNLD